MLLTNDSNKPIQHVECAGALGQSIEFCH